VNEAGTTALVNGHELQLSSESLLENNRQNFNMIPSFSRSAQSTPPTHIEDSFGDPVGEVRTAGEADWSFLSIFNDGFANLDNAMAPELTATAVPSWDAIEVTHSERSNTLDALSGPGGIYPDPAPILPDFHINHQYVPVSYDMYYQQIQPIS
jgi:hypothetical protein